MGNTIKHPSVELPPEKQVMVTGANTGIGYETAKSMAEIGAKVCIACRSKDKAKAAIERMQKEHRDGILKTRQTRTSSQAPTDEVEIKPLNVDFIKVDLSSLQSTMDFIQEVKQKMPYLNILVCNAGIAMALQAYTEDNFESHFQVNYLSHLLIVLHLLPLMRAGAPDSRIVLLSSVSHKYSPSLDLDNMQYRNSYSRVSAYTSSKAYMTMAANFLSRRLEETGVSTFSVDPGVVDTDIVKNYSDWKLLSYVYRASKYMGLLRTPKQGAATSVTACVDPNLRGKTAVHLINCQPASAATFCCDVKNQEELWSYSLGSLSKFISDDVLKDAFPSAKPELLVIPADAKTVEDKIADDLGKEEGNTDDKEAVKQSQGGRLETGQDEEQPKIESSSGNTDPL